MTPVNPEQARESMVETQVHGRGITDAKVLTAMASVPRELFVPDDLAHLAYGDYPVPIAENQTISQPYIVGLMTEALGEVEGRRVLELGTGAGYQTAILLEMGAQVQSVERHGTLATQAEKRLRALGYTGFEIHEADGTLGWPPAAPYDAILATAAAPAVPQPLLAQLSEGGILLIPVGTRRDQRLLRITRSQTGDHEEDLGAVVFLPLIGESGFPG